MSNYKIQDKDAFDEISTNPEFKSALSVTDFTKAYTGFPTDTKYAKKITSLGWGIEYPNFPFRLKGGSNTDHTPKFLTKASCPVPYRGEPDRTAPGGGKYSNETILGVPWGDVIITNGYTNVTTISVTVTYTSGTITISVNNPHKTISPISFTPAIPLIFIDLCGGGGCGGQSKVAWLNAGAGGGGGGAAACFMAVNMAEAKKLYIEIGTLGYNSNGGRAGGDTKVFINDETSASIILGGGKKGSNGTNSGTSAGGAGGECSGSLWNGSSYNLQKGIKAIVGFHGKAGAASTADITKGNGTIYGNRGGSFQPTSGSDAIPNFGIFDDFKIGYSADGTQNSQLGCGGITSVFFGDGWKKCALGGGGGACAMGVSSSGQMSATTGAGGSGNDVYNHDQSDGWIHASSSPEGRAGGAGACVIHYKYSRIDGNTDCRINS